MPEKLDGVACEPGDIIFSDDGTVWYCNDVSHQYQKAGDKVMPKIPDCGPREVLAWNADRNVFECITDDPRAGVEVPVVKPIDPLWIIFWVGVVFVVGSLAVGLTQWWRNRRAKREADLEVWNKLLVPELKQKMAEEFPKSELDKFTLGITPEGDIQMAEVTKPQPTPQQLMMDLREAFMQVQLARGEINKIPGMVQVYVNGAMQHLDKARDIVSKACAEVGTLKVQP